MNSSYYRPKHYHDYPIVLESGVNSKIIDTTGKEYYDLFAAMGTISCGHANEYIIEYISKQIHKITASSFFPTDIQLELIDELNSILPEQLEVAILYSTGAEAIEQALRLARVYTGKDQFISLENCFHGKSHGTMYLYNNTSTVYGKKPGSYSTSLSWTSDEFEDQLEKAIGTNTAGIIFECVLGQDGGQALPLNVLQSIKNICEKTGALIISDEILTGIYRCGDWFVSPKLGLLPDIICFGKGLGNGLPISGVACRQAINSHIGNTIPGSTFAGNPISCAAAVGVIKYLKRIKDIENRITELSTTFNKYFSQNKYNELGIKIHGIGALLGLQLQQDKYCEISDIYKKLIKKGVITSHSNKSLRITPPLTISKVDFTNALTIIGNTLIESYKD